jgi:hypothetical protein
MATPAASSVELRGQSWRFSRSRITQFENIAQKAPATRNPYSARLRAGALLRSLGAYHRQQPDQSKCQPQTRANPHGIDVLALTMEAQSNVKWFPAIACCYKPFDSRKSFTTAATSRWSASTAAFMRRISSAEIFPAKSASAARNWGNFASVSSRTMGTASYGGK